MNEYMKGFNNYLVVIRQSRAYKKNFGLYIDSRPR